MLKKILILETSVTVQKLFTNSLDAKKYTIKFESESKKIFSTFTDFQPDIVLINCDIDTPKSFEIVKILHTINDFQNLAIGMYSNLPSAIDQALAKEAGAAAFINLESETIADKVNELISQEEKNTKEVKSDAKNQGNQKIDDSYLFTSATSLLTQNSYKNLILLKLADLIGQLENLPELIRAFLILIAQVCEAPLAALYIIENDGPHSYYVCADNLDKKDISDFLKVCSADFEKNENDGIRVTSQPVCLDSEGLLEAFNNTQIKLSSYEFRALKVKEAQTALGTVHIVLQGNILKDKIEYFEFCINNTVELFEKAVVVEKKMYFEKRIRRAFSRFVPEQIIDSLVSQVDDTNQKVGVGETRSVAILFSDIRSFTNISEKNRPDVLVAFLNRYFSTMVDIIKKHGGTIDKFIGDAIMAEFGTPVSYDDNCARAVKAAYEMRDALSTIELGDLVMPDGMVFNIGIGIHYGDVIVGSIGSKDKTDYSVIGDNVNLASRLEGLTKTYGVQILVSETVKEDAGQKSFCFRHLDDVRVKGKKNAVPIYAVDRSPEEFSAEYKDSYIKGMELYKQGIWNLAKDYFLKALDEAKGDKAAKLMLDRCQEFINNPPENWDGAIAFMTK